MLNNEKLHLLKGLGISILKCSLKVFMLLRVIINESERKVSQILTTIERFIAPNPIILVI